jgi:hypothetical protein
MSGIRLAVDLLRLTAAFLAVVVARRRPEHRPVALFLVVIVLAALARPAIEATGIVPSTPSPVPLAGLPRVAAHALQALYLLWPFGVLALVRRAFTGKGVGLIATGYTLSLAGLIAGYPMIRGALLARTYTALELASLLVSIGFVTQWWQRRLIPTLSQVAAGLILTVELMTLLGPYRAALFSGWERALAIYMVMYGALVVFHGGIVLWSFRSTSEPR